MMLEDVQEVLKTGNKWYKIRMMGFANQPMAMPLYKMHRMVKNSKWNAMRKMSKLWYGIWVTPCHA